MKGLNRNVIIGLVIAVIATSAFLGASLLQPLDVTVDKPSTTGSVISTAKEASDAVISVSANIDEVLAALEDIDKSLG